MSHQANINLSGSVEGGASLSEIETIAAEGQVHTKMIIPDAAVDTEVEGVPAVRTGILFLMIKPSVKGNGSNLSYKVGADTTVYQLDGTHVFRGPGQAAMLPVDPTDIKVSNSTGVPVTIELFALYNTTP